MLERRRTFARLVQKRRQVKRAVVQNRLRSGAEFRKQSRRLFRVLLVTPRCFDGEATLLFDKFFVLFKKKVDRYRSLRRGVPLLSDKLSLQVGVFSVATSLLPGQPNRDVLHGFFAAHLYVPPQIADRTAHLAAGAGMTDNCNVLSRIQMA